MREQSNHRWHTADELQFLKHLGRGRWSRESSRVKEAGREQLLRRYKQACLDRATWDTVDRGAVSEYVDKCLIEFVK